MCVPSPRPPAESPSLCSAACAVAPAHCPLTSRLAPRPGTYAHLASRQGAENFNQPLTLDTSSVTTMYGMFEVRIPSPRPLQPRALPSAVPLAPSPPRTALSPPARPARPPASYTHLATRQDAENFNQPLTLDTSKVTTMMGMFGVRALAPTSPAESPSWMPLAPPPRTALSHLPARTSPSPRMPTLRPGSTHRPSTSR